MSTKTIQFHKPQKIVTERLWHCDLHGDVCFVLIEDASKYVCPAQPCGSWVADSTYFLACSPGARPAVGS